MKKRLIATLMALAFMFTAVGVVHVNAGIDLTYPTIQVNCCTPDHEEIVPLSPPSWENGGGDGSGWSYLNPGPWNPPPPRCCPGMCGCGRIFPSFSCSC